MRPTAPTPRAFRSQRFIVLALLLASTACEIPNFQGPQIQSPPPAFYMQPEAYQQRRMFPDLGIVVHKAWVETSGGPFSGIYVNGHAGVLTQDDVIAAREEAMAAATDPITFGNVEAFTIDTRRAWGWSERLETRALGLDWIAYRAVVPYDTITFALEFYGGDPGLKNHPDSLRTILASFAIGETVWNLPLIAVFVGMTLFLIVALRSRAQARARRLQSIQLVKIKKEDDQMADRAGESQPAGSGKAPPSASGPTESGESGPAQD